MQEGGRVKTFFRQLFSKPGLGTRYWPHGAPKDTKDSKTKIKFEFICVYAEMLLKEKLSFWCHFSYSQEKFGAFLNSVNDLWNVNPCSILRHQKILFYNHKTWTGISEHVSQTRKCILENWRDISWLICSYGPNRSPMAPTISSSSEYVQGDPNLCPPISGRNGTGPSKTDHITF